MTRRYGPGSAKMSPDLEAFMKLRMFVVTMSVLAAAQTVSTQQPAAQRPAIGASANIKSPDVSADRNVTFRIAAPNARAVSVVCECLTLEEIGKLKQQLTQLGQRPESDPDVTRLNRAIANIRSNQGERALAKDVNGVWSLTLPAVEADIYEYHFSVDGFDMLDPRNPVVKYNSRPNLIESLLEVKGSAPLFYDTRPVPHGSVEMRSYDSKATSSIRRAFVYTPPGYAKSTTRLPVLYLLHGADGD